MTRLQMLVFSVSTPETDGLTRAASQARVEVFRTADYKTALDWLSHRKFDGVIVDSGTFDAERVLHATMLSNSNSKAATVSIISSEDQIREIIRIPTSFKLWKGVPPTAIANAFRVLYVSMVAERQRYFRCPVDLLVRFRKEDAPAEICVAHALNLSRGGMAFKALNVQKGDQLTLEFCLPKGGPVIRVGAEVLRCSDDNRTSVRFAPTADKKRALLHNWLGEQCVLALAECSGGIAKQIEGIVPAFVPEVPTWR